MSRWKSPQAAAKRAARAAKEAKKLRWGWLLVLCVLLIIGATATDLYFIAYEGHQRQDDQGAETNVPPTSVSPPGEQTNRAQRE